MKVKGKPKQTEKSFQKMVIELAHLKRWVVAHFRPAMDKDGYWKTPVQADGAGFPDLVLVRPPRILFVELKRDGGNLTDLQRVWAGCIKACEGNNRYLAFHVWHPHEWEIIEKTLE